MVRPKKPYDENPNGYLLRCPECSGEVYVLPGQVDVNCASCAWHGPWLACVMDMMIAAQQIAETRQANATLRAENIRLTNINNRLTRPERVSRRVTRTSRERD